MTRTFVISTVAAGIAGILLAATVFAAQSPTITGVTSAASFQTQQVASLGYVAVFGTGLSDGVYSAPNANYGTQLGPTQIFICQRLTNPDGSPLTPATNSACKAARIAFASPGQVNVVMPAITGPPGQNYFYAVASVSGILDAATTSGNGNLIQVNAWAPAVFLAGSDCDTSITKPVSCGLSSVPASATRAQRGVVTDINGNLVWSGNRARLGKYYTAWVTGMGVIPTGQGSNAPVQMPTLVPAYGYTNPSGGSFNVSYSGAVTQYPGLYQVNFQIPLNIGEGPYGYGAWPCGNYNWELPVEITESGSNGTQYSNSIQIPLTIFNGDVPCAP